MHRRKNRFARHVAAVFVALATAATSGAADEPVSILVLKEHGAGNPALAQPYLDKFVALAAIENGWPAAQGRYFTSRDGAFEFIRSKKPHYAILSLGAFLALKAEHKLDVVGDVSVELVGGGQYFIVSKTAKSLADCRGKPLASDHVEGDERFIEGVVAKGAFKLADFTLTPTRRPLQTITKVLKGEATCALIDDAQMEDLEHIQGGDEIHAVWESRELPAMVVVAFPRATAQERATFQKNLPKLCDGSEKSACGEVGIVELSAASDADFAELIADYSR